YFGLL
ncbi:hypothetical protein D046_8417B, partial [Vibrio parahaemolyticus V-223/04]